MKLFINLGAGRRTCCTCRGRSTPKHKELFERISQRLQTRDELDALNFEMFNNLVVEATRLGIEVKNLRMQVESLSTRLDFDERRARALEGVVQYRPGTPLRRRRRRRRRSDEGDEEAAPRRRGRTGRRPRGAPAPAGAARGRRRGAGTAAHGTARCRRRRPRRREPRRRRRDDGRR